MYNDKNSKGAIAFALSLIFLSAFVVPNARADERISSQITLNSAIQLTDKEKDSLALAAEQILQQVREARADIKYEGGARALEHVQKGLDLVKIIDNALPEYDVNTTIKSGEFNYRDEEKRKQFVVPVYSELDEMFATLPHVKAAMHEGGGIQPRKRGKGEEEVLDTRIFLNVRDASHYLQQAATDMQNNNPSKADKSLATLQNNVIHEFREVDLPLSRARWSLMKASRMALNHDYRQARTFLQEAVDQLEIYKSEVDQKAADTSQAVINDIRNVSNRLKEQNEASAQRIAGIWDKLAGSF